MATEMPVLEYLATTRIGEKGQLTVPKHFREDLGLGTGSPFAVLRIGDALFLIPEQSRFEELCDEIRRAFLKAGAPAESLLDTLHGIRGAIYEERYGAPISRVHERRDSRRSRTN